MVFNVILQGRYWQISFVSKAFSYATRYPLLQNHCAWLWKILTTTAPHHLEGGTKINTRKVMILKPKTYYILCCKILHLKVISYFWQCCLCLDFCRNHPTKGLLWLISLNCFHFDQTIIGFRCASIVCQFVSI